MIRIGCLIQIVILMSVKATADTNHSRLERIIYVLRQRYDGTAADVETEDCSDMHTCYICGHSWKRTKNHPNPRICPVCKSTLWNRKDARKCLCKRCDHVWFSVDPHPLRCPNCKTKTWDAQYLMVRCEICGTKWKDAFRVSKNFRCPVCGPIDQSRVKVVSRYQTYQKKVDNDPDKRTIITREVSDVIISTTDVDSRTKAMMDNGLSVIEAEVLSKFIEGDDPITLARRNRISLHEVMMIIVSYVRESTERGDARWI